MRYITRALTAVRNTKNKALCDMPISLEGSWVVIEKFQGGGPSRTKQCLYSIIWLPSMEIHRKLSC